MRPVAGVVMGIIRPVVSSRSQPMSEMATWRMEEPSSDIFSSLLMSRLLLQVVRVMSTVVSKVGWYNYSRMYNPYYSRTF